MKLPFNIIMLVLILICSAAVSAQEIQKNDAPKPEIATKQEAAKPAKTKQEAPKKAPDDYQLYLKSGDRSPKWNEYIEPGFHSFDGGNLPTSYVFLRRAYDLGCRDGLLLYRLGLYKESQRQYKEAADMLAEAAKKIPEQYPGHTLSQEIHEHAGRILYLSDNYDGALPLLQKALEVTPDNFALLFMAGQIQRLKGNYQEARNLLERALLATPPEGLSPALKFKVVKELMIVCYELKDLDATLKYADTVLAVTPNDPTAMKFKGLIEKEKQRQREREVIQKIVK